MDQESLTLLLAERDPDLRAVIDFAGAAGSWEGSPPLQARLLASVAGIAAPVLFLQAANDYSIAPTRMLADQMARLGKPHSAKIYRPVGRSPAEGHGFLFLSVDTWETDVFAFLDTHLRESTSQEGAKGIPR